MAERPKSKDSPNTQRTILVTGATGQQGGAVLRRLRERGFPVRALTRDPDKPAARALAGHGIEIVRGDFDDPASIGRALEGVYGVFSVQPAFPAGVEAEVRHGKLLAQLAERAHISHLVYTSVGGADRNTGVPHFDSKWQIEEHIRSLGLPHTIFRPVFFMENWAGMGGMLAQGAITLPLSPARTLQLVAVDDIGAFVALAFQHPGRWLGQVIELAGDERSMRDTADLFGRITGREIRYQQIPWEAFGQQAGHEMTVMMRWFEEAGYRADIAALREIYPRLTTLDRWAQAQDWQRILAARARPA
jgi:uncharacterized protein YbjT (DUF2867 family)